MLLSLDLWLGLSVNDQGVVIAEWRGAGNICDECRMRCDE